MSASGCDLCDRALVNGEPRYPVRIDGEEGDIAVCVECALYLARKGVGAWQTRHHIRTGRGRPPSISGGAQIFEGRRPSASAAAAST